MVVYRTSLGSPSGRAVTALAVTERVFFVETALSVSPLGCHLSHGERQGVLNALNAHLLLLPPLPEGGGCVADGIDMVVILIGVSAVPVAVGEKLFGGIRAAVPVDDDG